MYVYICVYFPLLRKRTEQNKTPSLVLQVKAIYLDVCVQSADRKGFFIYTRILVIMLTLKYKLAFFLSIRGQAK